jgi:hypothetical protein
VVTDAFDIRQFDKYNELEKPFATFCIVRVVIKLLNVARLYYKLIVEFIAKACKGLVSLEIGGNIGQESFIISGNIKCFWITLFIIEGRYSVEPVTKPVAIATI